GQRGRQYAARRATGQIGLEYMAILHATAKLIDKLTHGDAGGGQLDAWVLHAAGNREAAEAPELVPPLRGHPLGPLLDDVANPEHRLDVLLERRTSQQTDLRNVRRAMPPEAPVAP